MFQKEFARYWLTLLASQQSNWKVLFSTKLHTVQLEQLKIFQALCKILSVEFCGKFLIYGSSYTVFNFFLQSFLQPQLHALIT